MKLEGRKRQLVECGIMMTAGLLLLIGITLQEQSGEKVEEPVKEVVMDHTNSTKETSQIRIDTKSLYEQGRKTLTQEHLEEVAAGLLGKHYLKQVFLQEETLPQTITLIYTVDTKEQGLSKVNRDQMAYVNACSLMSLYNQIDIVKIIVEKGNEVYEQDLYRPDFENYFGVSTLEASNIETFERFAEEFLDADCVSTYSNCKKLFDSRIGEEVSSFYKKSFPVMQANDEVVLGKVNLEEEERLFQKYDYKLFIQGLWYPNPSMNYYAAYQLMEDYGSSHLEEILVELIACQQNTENEQVRLACEQAVDVLSHKEVDTPKLFTKFNEIDGYLEPKVQGIINGRLMTLAQWKEKEVAQIKVISVSPQHKQVLCEVITKERAYLYILPIDEKGDYHFNKVHVLKDDHIVSKEIYQYLLEKEELEQAEIQLLNSESVKYSWKDDNLLQLEVSGHVYMYQCQRKILQTRETFRENYNAEDFRNSLEQQMSVRLIGNYKEKDLNASLTKLKVGEEIINIYEFPTQGVKQQALSKQDSVLKTSHRWQQGKIVICYQGEDEILLEKIQTILKNT